MDRVDVLVAPRRRRAERAWELNDEIVLVGAGSPINKPGGFDQCYEYIAHPQYRWLTNATRAGSVVAFDPKEGWTHFVVPISEHERVWDGEPEIPEGAPREELKAWLEARAGRPIAVLGATIPDVAGDEELSKRLGIALDHERRAKDARELEIMRRCAAATAAGYEAARHYIRPGVTERQIQVELEAAMGRAGAHGMGYATIVGTGPNSRVFHFTPGDRVVQPGELVLIDAGAHVDAYVIDVTRTFPADGEWKGRQAAVREIVREAEEAVFALCRPGTLWSECHRAAANVIARGIVDLGLAKGSPESLCESEAIAMFLPHGVGHAVGLGVRDSGGAMPGAEEEPKMVCGVKIRVDLPLAPGYVMTVEPGLYFIPALLSDPARREKFADVVNWDAVDGWLDFGGLRLEDNLVITEGDPENLTVAIPW
jgi:Xaa-Pro aminopeptidase